MSTSHLIAAAQIVLTDLVTRQEQTARLLNAYETHIDRFEALLSGIYENQARETFAALIEDRTVDARATAADHLALTRAISVLQESYGITP